VEYKESRIGGRYGRRLARLAKKAQAFHDVRPQHRITKIMIDDGKSENPLIIYEPNVKTGCAGVMQRIQWGLKHIFNIY
jgi:hypothetical protein